MMRPFQSVRQVIAVTFGVAWLLVCLAAVPGAYAQEPATPALPDPLTPAAVDALVSRLSDAEVRDLLLTELRSRAVAQADAMQSPDRLADGLTAKIGNTAAMLAAAIRESPAQAGAGLAAFRDYLFGIGRAGTAWLALVLGLAIALGLGADRAVTWRGAAPVRLPVRRDTGIAPLDVTVNATFALLSHMSRGVVGAVVAPAVGAAVVSAILPLREARVALAVLVWLVFIPRLGLELARLHRARTEPGDRAARLIPAGILLAAVLTGVGEVLTRVAVETGRQAQTQGAGFWLGTTVFALLAAMVWLSRAELGPTSRGESSFLGRTCVPLGSGPIDLLEAARPA